MRMSKLIKIGKGAYGSVYQCVNESNESIVIKKMTFEENDEIVEPNLREVCFLATLQNTPCFSEYIKGERKGNNLILQQKNKGVSLSSLSHIQTFEERKAFFPVLIGQLAKILCILKRLNVVHRDIKDANICVDEENNISLIDFGLIKLNSTNQKFDGYNGTEYNRDLKLDNKDMIDWKYDMFSSGITLFTYLKDGYPKVLDINEYKNDVDPTLFQAWTKMLQDDRITPEQLFQITNGVEFENIVEYKSYTISDELNIQRKNLYILIDWMIDVFCKCGTYLIKYGIHLLLRYLNKVSITPKKDKLQCIVSSVIYLSCILNNNTYLSPESISILTEGAATASEIIEYAGEIAHELEYEIFPFGFEDEVSYSKSKTKDIYLDKIKKDLHSTCFKN